MRSLLLVPWSLSRVVVGLLWIGILDFEFGALNGVLHPGGLIDGSIAFFKDGFRRSTCWSPSTCGTRRRSRRSSSWPGMQSIPEDHYSAAEVDGAGYWQRLCYVTLPALRPDPVPGPGAGAP